MNLVGKKTHTNIHTHGNANPHIHTHLLQRDTHTYYAFATIHELRFSILSDTTHLYAYMTDPYVRHDSFTSVTLLKNAFATTNPGPGNLHLNNTNNLSV